MISAIVKLSELYRHLRIDAEYYKPEYLALEIALSKRGNLYPLRKYCSYIKKGIFDISPDLYTNSGVPLIRTSEIKNPLTNFTTTVYLDEKTHQEHYKTELHPNDIVITKIGAYIGDVAILPSKHPMYNFSQNVTGLSIKQISINSCYLFAFLMSQYGKSQIKRVIMLSGQGKIELEDIKDLTVYEASKTLQDKIGEAVTLSQDLIEESETVFSQAERFLLSELGLLDWRPGHCLSFVKNYSDAAQAQRIDAEYFQPKYEQIVNAVKSYKGGWDTLGNLVSVKKCVEVGSGEYLDEGIPFIRVSNLSPFEITEEKYISEKLYSELTQHQPKQGEILFSKDATPGIAYYLKEKPAKMIPSGGILRLKLKDKRVNEDYLTLVLNSLIVKEQINRDVGGSVILHWRPDQVKETLIPLLHEDIQSRIRQKIDESFALRRKSKHLLACAKQAVETAIERDEKIAMKWMKQQAEKLKI